ncbi:MAG: hypothetical protein WAN58_06270 [Anaerolineales bacterium]
MQTQLQNAPCPKCGSTDAKKVSITWWGGALGPRLFNLVKCNSCGTEYNGKTGKPNQQNMIIYIIVSILVVFCLCGGLSFLGTMLNQR